MRMITDHVVNQANDRLRIEVTDEPGAGGANHRYVVTGFDGSHNPSRHDGDDTSRQIITFQNGPIAEAGVNGTTQEVLLAIVADRLRSFQAGAFACPENAAALAAVEQAMAALLSRTKARMRAALKGRTLYNLRWQ
jgi:hypothetical protein